MKPVRAEARFWPFSTSIRRGAAIRLQLGVTRTRQNDLNGGNRQQMNSRTDKRPDDRAVYSDVLKVATEDQF